MRPADRLRRDARLAALTLSAAWRTPAVRRLATVVPLIGGVLAWGLAGLGADATRVLPGVLAGLVGFAATVGMAAAGTRDLGPAGALVRAKPAGGAERLSVVWASEIFLWAGVLALSFALAASAAAPRMGSLALSIFAGYPLAALVIAARGTISFSGARLLRLPAAGAFFAVLWGAAAMGRLPRELLPGGDAASLAVAAAFLAAVLVRERTARGQPVWSGLAALALGTATAGSLLVGG